MDLKNVKNIVTGIIPNSTTPARYYFDNQTIFINLPYWAKLTEDEKFFVLLHETGHAELNSKDEVEADQFALENYLANGGKLTEALYSLTDNLNTKNPLSKKRIKTQFKSLVNYDINHNNNQLLKKKINTMNIPYINENQNPLFNQHQLSADFLGIGIGKEAREERRLERQRLRDERRGARTGILKGKAESLLAGAGGLISNLLAGRKNNITDENLETQSEKNNTTMYVIIGVVLIGIIGTVIYFTKKK